MKVDFNAIYFTRTRFSFLKRDSVIKYYSVILFYNVYYFLHGRILYTERRDKVEKLRLIQWLKPRVERRLKYQVSNIISIFLRMVCHLFEF